MSKQGTILLLLLSTLVAANPVVQSQPHLLVFTEVDAQTLTVTLDDQPFVSLPSGNHENRWVFSVVGTTLEGGVWAQSWRRINRPGYVNIWAYRELPRDYLIFTVSLEDSAPIDSSAFPGGAVINPVVNDGEFAATGAITLAVGVPITAVAFVDLSDATLVPYTPPPPEAPMPGLIDQIPPAEYAALVDFYTSLQGPWYESDGWSDPTASSWNGITVSGFDYDHRTGEVLSVGHVTELNLYSRGLSGPLPESLGNLTYLQVLNLTENEVSGTIPASLGNLTDLHLLSFGFNQLSGEIPEALANLVNLQNLLLGNNQLTGGIPEFLGDLVNLNVLGLGGNQLTGSVPDRLINLSHLAVLGFEYNQLSGNIPDFSVLPHLFSLSIGQNCFDISPGSQVRTILHKFYENRSVNLDDYSQRLGCGPVAFGDLNNDGCVDRTDVSILMTQVRNHSNDLAYDLNGDGKVDVADARFLVMRFTKPDGAPCEP